MAEPLTSPVSDPTGKGDPARPERDPPTGTDIVPPDPDETHPGRTPDPPPRREGVVSNPDGEPDPARA